MKPNSHGAQPVPLTDEMRCYVRHLDAWLASRRRSQQHRAAMAAALTVARDKRPRR